MTLFELLAIVLWLGLGIGGAVLGADRCGVIGGLVGGVLGLTIYPGVLAAISGVQWLLKRGRLRLPLCKSGRCRAEQYVEISRGEEGRVLQCRCGDQYLQVIRPWHQDLKFINAQGEAVPYMRFEGFGPWRPPSPEPEKV